MLRDRRGRFATAETIAAERFDDFALAARFEGYAEEAERETKAPPHANRRREGGKAGRYRKSKARQ